MIKMVKIPHESRDNQLSFQIVSNVIFEIFKKILKTTWNSPGQLVELSQKLAIGKLAPQS